MRPRSPSVVCLQCAFGIAVLTRLPHLTSTAVPFHPPAQVRVLIGGVQIRPGDWVYADLDGVLVSKEQLTL